MNRGFNPAVERRGKPYSNVRNYVCGKCGYEGFCTDLTKLHKLSCWKCGSDKLERV